MQIYRLKVAPLLPVAEHFHCCPCAVFGGILLRMEFPYAMHPRFYPTISGTDAQLFTPPSQVAVYRPFLHIKYTVLRVLAPYPFAEELCRLFVHSNRPCATAFVLENGYLAPLEVDVTNFQPFQSVDTATREIGKLEGIQAL